MEIVCFEGVELGDDLFDFVLCHVCEFCDDMWKLMELVIEDGAVAAKIGRSKRVDRGCE